MLLIVGHPSIGAALETLLRIEERYETRRVQSVDQVSAVAGQWPADVALIDGVLVESGRAAVLTIPAVVLSGNAADGTRLAARLSNGRGWLRKDATAPELRLAIDRALRGETATTPRSIPPALLVGAAGIVIVMLIVAALMFRG